jgi:hypothetical protein
MEKQRHCPACGAPIKLEANNMFSCDICGSYGKDFSKNLTSDEIEMIDEIAFQKRVKQAMTKVDINKLHANYGIEKIAEKRLNLIALGGIKIQKDMPSLKDIKDERIKMLAHLGGVRFRKNADTTGLSDEDKKKVEIAQKHGIKLKKGTIEKMKEKGPNVICG